MSAELREFIGHWPAHEPPACEAGTYLLLQVYKDAGDDFWPSWQHIVNGEPVRADLLRNTYWEAVVEHYGQCESCNEL